MIALTHKRYHRWQQIGLWWRIVKHVDSDYWLARCLCCGLECCLSPAELETLPGCRYCREERAAWSEKRRFVMMTRRLHAWLQKRAVGRQLQIIKWYVQWEQDHVAAEQQQKKKEEAKNEPATTDCGSGDLAREELLAGAAPS